MNKRIGLAGLIFAVALAAAPAMGQMEVTTVALKGDLSPVWGLWYRRFKQPAVGDTGAPVSFWARLRGLGGGSKGIFKDDPIGPGSTVALFRDPGPQSRVFSKFSNPTMNATGSVAFDARLSGGTKGVFRDGPSTVALLGDTVPGVTGLLKGFASAFITDGGAVVFKGTISGAASVGGVDLDEGIFRCSGGDGDCSSGTGALETLVLRNDPVDDRPGRELCHLYEPAASDFGVAFYADTKEDCGDGAEFTRRGVFRLAYGGSTETIALEGESCEPEPGTGGTTYGLIRNGPDISNDGSVVFKARTMGILSNAMLYLCDSATCPAAAAEAAVSQGQADPDGNAFKYFSTPAVSDAGDMAFKARGRGATGTVTGVYVRRGDGTLETIALTGHAVPNLLPQSQFSKIRAKGSGIDMSSGGRVAFKAKVRRTLPPRFNLEGIFLAE